MWVSLLSLLSLFVRSWPPSSTCALWTSWWRRKISTRRWRRCWIAPKTSAKRLLHISYMFNYGVNFHFPPYHATSRNHLTMCLYLHAIWETASSSCVCLCYPRNHLTIMCASSKLSEKPPHHHVWILSHVILETTLRHEYVHPLGSSLSDQRGAHN